MTKQHFEAFAEEIGKMIRINPEGAGVATVVVATVALKFNSNFDVGRFHKAILEAHLQTTEEEE